MNPKLDLFTTLALSLGLKNQIFVPEIYSYSGKVINRKKYIFEVTYFVYIMLSKHKS